MWPFHLMHTALSGALLVHGWRQYNGVIDIIDNASHWELAGVVMLITAFGYGSAKLFLEIRSALKRIKRNKSAATNKALRNAKGPEPPRERKTIAPPRRCAATEDRLPGSPHQRRMPVKCRP